MRIHQLKIKLASCKQEGQTIDAYYGKLKSKWEELIGYTKNRICICIGCTCGAAKELAQEREKEKVHQFLNDEVFGTTRSNILSTKSLPTLNRVYAMIIQEERHQNLARAKEDRPDDMAFVVHSLSTVRNDYSGIQSNDSDKPLCSKCGKFNHETKICFLLIGYPKWWGTGGGASNRIKWYDKGRSNVLGIRWIVDTGESHHISGDAQLLNDLCDVPPYLVSLPNGSTIVGSKMGTVILTDKMKLHHVLYVPQ
ncbi:hypothetical protein KY284_030341 [Solanum tuberosum]|nr:hypothetical protein KY284_030341 [Solanum tuberosum]